MNAPTITALYDSAGNLVGVTNEEPISLPGISYKQLENAPDLNRCKWNPETLEFERVSSVYSKLQFLSKFTIEERTTIRASTNVVVQDFLKMIELAEFIDVKDQRTIMGVQFLAQIGLIDPARAQQILSIN